MASLPAHSVKCKVQNGWKEVQQQGLLVCFLFFHLILSPLYNGASEMLHVLALSATGLTGFSLFSGVKQRFYDLCRLCNLLMSSAGVATARLRAGLETRAPVANADSVNNAVLSASVGVEPSPGSVRAPLH